VTHPLFAISLNPMLIIDDHRRYVDANPAACLFLRLPRDEVRRLRIDDLTPPEVRPRLEARWPAFLRGDRGGQDGATIPWDFRMPDGTDVSVDISSIPHFRPGRHLAIVHFPAVPAASERPRSAGLPRTQVLSKREREVLTLVALGNTGVEIAAALFVSPATVETHVGNALDKLGGRNRAHGIAIALRTGELDLNSQ
jgi:DNA-binding CsgD family transcriptional regulator